jgi:hypothetical protein
MVCEPPHEPGHSGPFSGLATQADSFASDTTATATATAADRSAISNWPPPRGPWCAGTPGRLPPALESRSGAAPPQRLRHRHTRRLSPSPAEQATHMTLQAARRAGRFAPGQGTRLTVQAARRRTPADDRPVPARCSPRRQRHGQQATAAAVTRAVVPRPGAGMLPAGTSAGAGACSRPSGQQQMTAVKREPAVQPGPAGGAPPQKRARPPATTISPLATCISYGRRRPLPGGVHPADSRGGRGSPTGSLIGSQPPPSSSHTQPHRAW